MSQAILQAVQQSHLKTDLPRLSIGDTVDVHTRIIEGSKERIQVFTGVIIAMAGSGLERTVTVRRIVANEGVERIFPVHSPRIAKFEIKRHGHVRRAKLYYLRDRVGKKRRLADRRRKTTKLPGAEPVGGSREQSMTAAQSRDQAKAVEHEGAPVQEEAGRKA